MEVGRGIQSLEKEIAAAVENMHNHLDKIQFQNSFDESKFIVFDQDGYGFGAQFERRMLGLQFACMYGRSVVFVNENNPPYTLCFEPTGSITYSEIEHLEKPVFDYTHKQGDKVVFFDFDSFWRNSELNREIYEWMPEEFQDLDRYAQKTFPESKNWVHPEFKNLSRIKRIFSGELLSRFKYLPQFRSEIDAIKKRIGFESPIIGVHIRRGDKTVEAPYVPLRRYHSEILRAVKETGINNVFVTSDDPDVFSGLPGQSYINYIYDDEEPRFNNANHIMLRKNQELAFQETLTALKIYDLLSYCDVVIGQSNAHLTLLAMCRNEARKMGAGDYRLTKGDYCASFLGADPRDWSDVFSYKYRSMKRALRKSIKK